MVGQVQRRREGVQRLPGQGRRQGDDRQRGAQGAEELDELRAPARPSGRRARRSAAWSRATSRNWSSCATRPPSQLGFKNFHALQLYLNEQDGDASDQAVRRAGRADARAVRAPPRPTSTPGWPRTAASSRTTCMPWHYHDPFFQETPAVFAADLDAPFAKADLVSMCRDVLRRHRPADRPRHRRTAICTRRRARARTPSAPTSTARATCACWPTSGPTITGPRRCCTSSAIRSTAARTSRATLPYVLRMESHILTTEGVAMMFERLTKRGPFLEKMGVQGRGRQGVRRDRRQDAALSAADLLALVPGDAAFREGHVRESGPGPEQAVVGPGGEVPAGEAARRAATRRTTPARSTSSARRSTTTTT